VIFKALTVVSSTCSALSTNYEYCFCSCDGDVYQ